MFVNGYRPGALAALGFGVEEVADAKPGIIYVSESCYGDAGPFTQRRGFDLNAQAATGLMAADNQYYDLPNDQLSPAGAPIDYVTGYLGAAGAMAALWRRGVEGGSYHVRVSLCRSAMWIGEMEPYCETTPDMAGPDVSPWLVERDTAWGRLRQMGPVSELSVNPGALGNSGGANRYRLFGLGLPLVGCRPRQMLSSSPESAIATHVSRPRLLATKPASRTVVIG